MKRAGGPDGELRAMIEAGRRSPSMDIVMRLQEDHAKRANLYAVVLRTRNQRGVLETSGSTRQHSTNLNTQ